MTRWKASGIHFSISLIIGIAAFCLLYFVYYPQPYFVAAGASVLVLLLLCVDVVLGPLLTLIVFKSGKKTLKFDLAVIAVMQAMALVYGLYVVWISRPAFVLAVVDRLEIIYAGDIDTAQFALAEHPEFRAEPHFGPVFGFTRRPKPGAEQLDVIDSALAGADIQYFPKFFTPANPAALKAFLLRAIKLSDLPSEAHKLAESYVTAHQLRGEIVAVPMKGRTAEFTVLFHLDTGKLITALPIGAWD